LINYSADFSVDSDFLFLGADLSVALSADFSVVSAVSAAIFAAAPSFSASSSRSRLRSSNPSSIALVIIPAIKEIDFVASSFAGIAKSISVGS
jgi:hypothetical protein